MLDSVQLNLVQNAGDATAFLQWASKQDLLAVDTETTGLNPETDHVRLVQVGDDQTGWAIPWLDWGGVFRELVGRYTGRWICHNLKFDASMLAAEGCPLPPDRCEDTQLMAHVIEPTYSTALKRLAARYVDRRAGSLQTELDQALKSANAGWTWRTVPIDFQPYWTYAALDAVLTYRLFHELSRHLDEARSRRAYELELATSWVCNRMERNGFLVDRPYTRAARREFDRAAEQIVDWCLANFQCKPTQNAAVAEALIAAEIQLDQVTRTGAVKLDKHVLGEVDHELARQVLYHRQITKLGNTYLGNFLELTSGEDPRLHPRIKTVGARTSRMTMDTPNLQNLPRRSEENVAAITVRNCLIASEGCLLVMVDFDQIEMRILAHLAQDPQLIAAFLAPGDFFTTLTQQIFDDPSIVKKDPRRQTTKNAGYAKAYGAGIAKFADTAGISFERGAEVMNRFDQLYPGVRVLQQRVENVARERLHNTGVAYAKSPLTGRRHPADDDRLYTLINYLVQGTAAELFKQKLLELDASGLGHLMVLPVHDEVVLDVPREDVPDVTKQVLDVMNDDTILTVPITAGASVGLRWGEKRDYEPGDPLP